MPDYRFLLYRTADGKCILKLEGEEYSEEFADVLEAITAARTLHRLAALTIYDSLGQVMTETTL